MPEPWDRPPFPKQGNRSVVALYASIWRALNFWEQLETTLAHLFAALCEEELFDEMANQAYGEPTNFRGRIAGLKAAGCRDLQKRPNQTLEGDLAWVIRHAVGYSERRNDVAHGLARLIRMDDINAILGTDMRWCVVPPHFREDKFVAPNTPVYILTSREINNLAHAITAIDVRAWDLARNVGLPQHASRRRSFEQPT